MLITTRILHGFGLGMLICLVPLYLTEVSPAHCRGVMSGMTVMGFGLGYVAYVNSHSCLLILTFSQRGLGICGNFLRQKRDFAMATSVVAGRRRPRGSSHRCMVCAWYVLT
jgi:MFS family permease